MWQRSIKYTHTRTVVCTGCNKIPYVQLVIVESANRFMQMIIYYIYSSGCKRYSRGNQKLENNNTCIDRRGDTRTIRCTHCGRQEAVWTFTSFIRVDQKKNHPRAYIPSPKVVFAPHGLLYNTAVWTLVATSKMRITIYVYKSLYVTWSKF